ncbi:MAG: ABC transporter substrate-binding protein [Rothia sp. (in: high G+C Gram-positive bacteria)]|nr:ABC transporter substrate-binding protein [Rothia sp. (in: high G+C Gram-positive bacteria)]
MSLPTPRLRTACLTLASALILCSCASTSSTSTQNASSEPGFPLTIENCSTSITIDHKLERVALLEPASATALAQLGVLDRVVARAGAYPDEYYSPQVRSQIAEIPNYTQDLDPTGHVQISIDKILSDQPDSVFLGEVENITPESLVEMNIPVIQEPAMCRTGAPESQSYQSVYDQVSMYGKIFGVEDKAEQINSELAQRVKAAEETVEQSGRQGRTAAVLYPTVGGGTIYAYGTRSMADPQLTAAGFINVFADTDQRVFEVTPEELIARNPDVLILLHTDGQAQPVEDALRSMPGASSITAVKDDNIMVHLMNFTEPATPLSVTGLENIVDRFYS